MSDWHDLVMKEVRSFELSESADEVSCFELFKYFQSAFADDISGSIDRVQNNFIVSRNGHVAFMFTVRRGFYEVTSAYAYPERFENKDLAVKRMARSYAEKIIHENRRSRFE